MKLFNVKVRRDAHTITPVTVPAHEIAILQTLFGDENVQNISSQPVTAKTVTADDVAGDYKGIGGEQEMPEFDRLAAKYGGNEAGLLVEQVFGKKASGGLEKAMEAAEALAAKFDKAVAKK